MRRQNLVCPLFQPHFELKGPHFTSLAASEVSSILESRIAGTSLGGDVQETGRVLSKFCSRQITFLLLTCIFTAIGDGIARVYGAFNLSTPNVRVADADMFAVFRPSQCPRYVCFSRF